MKYRYGILRGSTFFVEGVTDNLAFVPIGRCVEVWNEEKQKYILTYYASHS